MSARTAESASTLDPWKIPLVGTSFIEASAGTGKTHALTTLYLRLLIEEDLGPADILVVTFTEAATAELRERIRDRIRDALGDGEGRLPVDEAGEARLRRALRDFDEAAIFTIHGFCQRTLKERAFESGLAFEAELVEKPEQRKRTLAHDLWTRLLAGEDDAFRAWLTTGPGRRRWTFEPESLFKLIHEQLGADDTMPILPERMPSIATSMAELEAAVDRGWRAFAESWASRREGMAALLLDKAQPFNGNQYKAASIQKTWLPTLDALASEVSAAIGTTGFTGTTRPALRLALEVPDFLEKLTPDGLRKQGRMKKDCPPPEETAKDTKEAKTSGEAKDSKDAKNTPIEPDAKKPPSTDAAKLPPPAKDDVTPKSKPNASGATGTASETSGRRLAARSLPKQFQLEYTSCCSLEQRGKIGWPSFDHVCFKGNDVDGPCTGRASGTQIPNVASLGACCSRPQAPHRENHASYRW